MKKKLLTVITVISLTVLNSQGQDSVDMSAEFQHVIKLIREDSISELALLINFPLKRENPLPDISTVNEFILYSPILLDSVFKKKLSYYHDSVIFEHNVAYGLVGGQFTGDIWIGDNGRIEAINYSSCEEKKLQQRLTIEIQNQIHPSVKSWIRNILVCESDKLLIRIDETDGGLRYVSWSKNHKISDAPDLILYHGVGEAQGTMGGWTYTFVNGEWSYMVDDVQICEDDHPEECGLFLRLLYGNIEKSTVRLKEIK